MSAAEPSTENIYAAPAARPERDDEYYVLDEYLVAKSPLELPRRCIKSNATECDGDQITMLRRKFADVNPWTIRLTRRRCQICYGLERSEKEKLSRALLLSRIAILLGLAGLPLAFAIGDDSGYLLLLAGLLIAILGAMCASQCVPLKVVKSSGPWFYVKGCSSAFLDSIANEESGSSPIGSQPGSK